MNILNKLNNIKDIKNYYNSTKPFYKHLCLEEPSNTTDIFPYIDNTENVMLDINSTNTHSENIKDYFNDITYIIDYLDNLIKQNINIIPFIFDYNINCYPRGWSGDGGCMHPIFQNWNLYDKIHSYNRKYIMYYIIKHFDIDKWPQPKIFYNYIYYCKLLDFIKVIDNKSLNECMKKIHDSYGLLDIYIRDINLDEISLDNKAINYLKKWYNTL
jgi:hypothetical protein